MGNGCPQCGAFLGAVEKGDMTNYNVAKGVVGEALLGTAGALAGFENKTVYECSVCGCQFYWNTSTTTKMLKRGYKTPEYRAPMGKGDFTDTVDCTNGYSYRVRKSDVGSGFESTYFEVKEPGKTYYDKHMCYGDTVKFEYDTIGRRLLRYYKCRDGRVRSKEYRFDSENDLMTIINDLISARDSQKDAVSLATVGGFASIIDITPKFGETIPKGTKDSRQIRIAIASAALGIFVGLFALSAGIGAFLATAFIGFCVSEIYLQFKMD